MNCIISKNKTKITERKTIRKNKKEEKKAKFPLPLFTNQYQIIPTLELEDEMQMPVPVNDNE